MQNGNWPDLDTLRSRWLDAHEEDLDEIGRYVIAMEVGDLELLMDPRRFYGPPRLLVRRGADTAEIWLDEQNLHFTDPGRFTEAEQLQLLLAVEKHYDDLLGCWFNFREDFKRGRLRRNPMTW